MADATLQPAPRIDWPDLHHLHQAEVSYDSFCETIDQYDTHLNASIEAIRKTVLHLRALRNSRGVVHRLPPEILIHILSELVFTSDPPSSTNLVAATHVCRRWRTIALDCPVLWAKIVGVNLYKTETFVQRSRDMLLDIHLDLGTFFKRPEVPHLRNLELGVLQGRLRSLTVMTGKSNLGWLDMFGEELANKPAPHLKALHLLNATSEWRPESCGHRRTSSSDLYWRTDHYPSTNSATPALRSLRLDSTFLPWDSEIYKNLVVLDVDARESRRYPLSEVKMLDILRQCPKLVELRIRLKGDFTGSDVPFDDHTRDVELPFLSTLSLEDFTPACVENFLSHLALPACTGYRVSLDQSDLGVEDSPSPDFPWVFPEDMSRLPGISTTKTAEFHVDGGYFLRLYSADAAAGSPTVHFSSTKKGEYGASYWVAAIPEDVLGSIERFVVNAPKTYLGFEWREIFRRAPHLRTLRLVRPDADDIHQALRALAPSIVLDNDELMCPQLECIEIVGRISSFKVWNEERAENYVRSRCHGDHGVPGAPFQRLVLEDGVMSELCVSRLRDLSLDVVICPREECSSGPDDDTLSASESE